MFCGKLNLFAKMICAVVHDEYASSIQYNDENSLSSRSGKICYRVKQSLPVHFVSGFEEDDIVLCHESVAVNIQLIDKLSKTDLMVRNREIF